MKLKTVEPSIGFYKKGDDFHFCVEKCSNVLTDALIMYALDFEANAKTLRALAQELKDIPDATGDGDTHCIFLTIPETIVSDLVEKGLVYFNEEEDDDYDEDDDSIDITV